MEPLRAGNDLGRTFGNSLEELTRFPALRQPGAFQTCGTMRVSWSPARPKSGIIKHQLSGDGSGTHISVESEERCFVQFNRIVVWEAFNATDPMTQAAGDLYEKTLPVDERIPWIWIEKSVESRTKTKPGKADGWTKHLLLAAPETASMTRPRWRGTSTAALIPNYGGYLCYIGVADWARRMGVGTRLFDQFFRQMAVDAGELGAPLPFVIWESHRPKPDAPATNGTCGRRGPSSSIASAGTGWRVLISSRRTSPARRTMPRWCHCNCS